MFLRERFDFYAQIITLEVEQPTVAAGGIKFDRAAILRKGDRARVYYDFVTSSISMNDDREHGQRAVVNLARADGGHKRVEKDVASRPRFVDAFNVIDDR